MNTPLKTVLFPKSISWTSTIDIKKQSLFMTNLDTVISKAQIFQVSKQDLTILITLKDKEKNINKLFTV